MCGPGCCGRKVIAVPLMLSRNEVAELSELIRLIRIQRGTLGLEVYTQRVHEPDGSILMVVSCC